MHRTHWQHLLGEEQRREQRRAEVRLAQGLRRLDEEKHFHLNTLNQEQQTLRQHFHNIKTGKFRKDLHDLGSRPTNYKNSSPDALYKKALLPTIPPADQMPDKHGFRSSLKARVQEFISSGENRAKNSAAPLCLPDLKLQPANTHLPAPSEKKQRNKNERVGEKEGENREQRTMLETEKSEDSETENDYCLRAVDTLPDFAQALLEARKACYIRHRGQPLWERELSIREIFCRNSRDANTTS